MFGREPETVMPTRKITESARVGTHLFEMLSGGRHGDLTRVWRAFEQTPAARDASERGL